MPHCQCVTLTILIAFLARNKITSKLGVYSSVTNISSWRVSDTSPKLYVQTFSTHSRTKHKKHGATPKQIKWKLGTAENVITIGIIL